MGSAAAKHDYQAIGAPFTRRWQRMDDGVAQMRRIWAGEPPFEGADPVGPPPVQPGGPPIVAGVMGPKALARAAHWAAGVDDGAHRHRRRSGRLRRPTSNGSAPPGRTPDATSRRTSRPASGTRSATAPPSALHDYAYTYLKLFGPEIADYMADACTASTPEALRETMAAAEAAGCDEMFLVPTTTDVTELDRTRDALGI